MAQPAPAVLTAGYLAQVILVADDPKKEGVEVKLVDRATE
jgi:hypothetical protein